MRGETIIKNCPILFLLFALGIPLMCIGCREKTLPTVTRATIAAPTGPCEVELSEPKFRFVPPEEVRFEVAYRFTQGTPNKNYLCEITFPGTENLGKKAMEAWELKSSGLIKGGIVMQSLEPMVKAFEMKLSEAETPQSGYQSISNTVSGEIVFETAK